MQDYDIIEYPEDQDNFNSPAINGSQPAFRVKNFGLIRIKNFPVTSKRRSQISFSLFSNIYRIFKKIMGKK